MYKKKQSLGRELMRGIEENQQTDETQAIQDMPCHVMPRY